MTRSEAQSVCLGEVCEIASALVDPREKSVSGLLHVGGANIESTTGRLINLQSAEQDQLISGKHRFSDQDVLYSKIRPYLRKVALPSFSGLCSADIYPLRPIDARLDREFLFYLLLSAEFTEYANRASNRAGMPKINREQLFAFRTLLPGRAEQLRIVGRIREFMDRVAELRQLREETTRDVARVTSAARFEAFGSSAPVIELSQLIVDGPTNGLYKPSSAYGAGTPIIRINNFDSGDRFSGGADLKRLATTGEERRRYALRAGDFVINRVNGSMAVVGKACTIERLDEATVFESNMMKFTVDEKRVDRSYVLHFLASPQCRTQIKTKAKVIQQASINQKDVTGLVLPLPSMVEQKAIASSLDGIADRARKLRDSFTEIGNVDRLSSSILRKALAGEL